jgi:hypothetical protein
MHTQRQKSEKIKSSFAYHFLLKKDTNIYTQMIKKLAKPIAFCHFFYKKKLKKYPNRDGFAFF